jgi:hypothetical protein
MAALLWVARPPHACHRVPNGLKRWVLLATDGVGGNGAGGLGEFDVLVCVRLIDAYQFGVAAQAGGNGGLGGYDASMGDCAPTGGSDSVSDPMGAALNELAGLRIVAPLWCLWPLTAGVGAPLPGSPWLYAAWPIMRKGQGQWKFPEKTAKTHGTPTPPTPSRDMYKKEKRPFFS